MLPFVERARGVRQNFSVAEFGSWSGTFSLELSERYPRSTLVALEPDRALWSKHASIARELRRRNLLFLRNPLNAEVAEALSHSNEFFDAQLLLSLQTTAPFDHGVKIGDLDRLKRLDTFVGHLLSLSRHSLVLLPAPPTDEQCRDNRLANWVDGAPAARLEAAAATLKMRLHTQRVLQGVAADGCPHEVWELGLAYMDRVTQP